MAGVEGNRVRIIVRGVLVVAYIFIPFVPELLQFSFVHVTENIAEEIFIRILVTARRDRDGCGLSHVGRGCHRYNEGLRSGGKE